MFNALAFISVIVVMVLLRTIVEILPSVLACLFRWKENLNIESSVRLSHDRDITALALYIPFCLTIFHFKIYNPSFIADLPDGTRLWAIIGVMTTYVLIRKAASLLSRPQRIPSRTLSAAEKSAKTYFILLALTLLLSGCVLSFFNSPHNTIRLTCLWLSALVYGLYLARKLQIFASSCSIFAAFLYLCALEILPTGILVVSDVIF